MKIFSSFDTDLDQKIYKQFVEKYGKECVMVIYRDKLFFFIFVLVPLFLYIFFIILMLILGSFVVFDDVLLNTIKWSIIGFVMFISFFMFGRGILKRYIDYKMDFAVVGPDEIVSYNQSGFFNLASRSLETGKIKTISVNKKGIFNSIFNYGALIFLSEGDNHSGDIQLYYISNPEEVRKRVKKIMDLGDDNGSD